MRLDVYPSRPPPRCGRPSGIFARSGSARADSGLAQLPREKEITVTETLIERPLPSAEPKTIEKVAIVVSKGSLEGIYSGLIMANGARMEGIEADVFFTFFGLDAIRKDRIEKIKVATVGNPGLHMPTMLGALPGMSALATRMMKRQMEKLDIPPIPEFVELLADSGAGLHACKASVDMFGLTMDDFVPQVQDVMTVGEFYELAAGGQIVFT
jgi:peroxiredoxin family protein